MKTTLTLLFLLLNRFCFSQESEIDTTFTIKTKLSEIYISSSYKNTNNLTSSHSFMRIKFNINNDVIEEAQLSNLLSDKAYIEIEYDENY